MKIVLAVMCLAAVVYAEHCRDNVVSTCVHTKATCTAVQTVACHNDQCLCANSCLQLSDCVGAPCSEAIHLYCINNACICDEKGHEHATKPPHGGHVP